MNRSSNIGRFRNKERVFIDETYIFAKKTCWLWCIVSSCANSSVVLELWRVEVDRTDFTADFKHKAERWSVLVTGRIVSLPFLTAPIGYSHQTAKRREITIESLYRNSKWIGSLETEHTYCQKYVKEHVTQTKVSFSEYSPEMSTPENKSLWKRDKYLA